MGRMVDLRGEVLGPRLTLQTGDVVLLPAAGARIESGDSVAIVGVHQNAAPVADGQVIAPAGAPDVVMLSATHAGVAEVSLITGDPFGGPAATPITIEVS